MLRVLFDEEATSAALTLPDDISVDAIANGPAYVMTIISILAILAVAIILTAYIIRKHGFSGFGLLLGIGVYVLFFAMAGLQVANLLLYALPKAATDNDLIKSLVAALCISVMSIGGRILSMFLFKNKLSNIKDSAGFGMGIMIAEAASLMLNFFMYVIFYRTLNEEGFGYYIENLTSQSDLDTQVEMFLVTGGEHFVSLLVGLSVMLIDLSMSTVMLAAFKSKINPAKGYGICLGGYFVVELFIYLASFETVPRAIEAVVAVVLAGAMVLYGLRMYHFHFKQDEEDEKEAKKKAETKKMPRYKNLSNM